MADGNDNDPPKRRKRDPMFYKTYVGSSSAKIPRTTLLDHQQTDKDRGTDQENLPSSCNEPPALPSSPTSSSSQPSARSESASSSPSHLSQEEGNSSSSETVMDSGSSSDGDTSSSDNEDNQQGTTADERDEQPTPESSWMEEAEKLRHKYSLHHQIPASDDRLTKFECMFLVFSYAMRHGLSDNAVADLLHLVNCVIGIAAIPETLWVFKKIFSYNSDLKYHFYCSACEAYIGKYSDFINDKKTSVECPIQLCNKKCSISTMNDGHFFIVLPLASQLKSFLENTPKVLDSLRYRFDREIIDDSIQDIFDGLLYKRLSQEGAILSDANNFSVTFNTDGVPIFVSKSNSMWAIQCRINELEPKLRFSSQNLFVSCIWFGSKGHPNMKVFMSQFVPESRSLHTEGFSWRDKDRNATVESKVVTLNCSLDAVAKADVQEIKHPNSYDSCGYCVHPGNLVDLTNNVLVPTAVLDQAQVGAIDDQIEQEEREELVGRVDGKKIVKQVRYSQLRGDYPPRTDAQMREDMVASEASGQPVRGLKGVSALMFLISFDVVFGFEIDAMHGVYLGVTLQLLNLWFDSKFSSKDFSIRKKIKDVDKILLNFKTPITTARKPQTVKRRGQWKANELRAWLLFYALPCLTDILPEIYLKHFALLVNSIQILSSDCISRLELTAAHAYLSQFVKEFEILYGPSQMVYNVHILTHLSECVKQWGPLWCYSAFPFESNNGLLKRLVKGTKGVMTQIAKKYCAYRFLPKVLAPYRIRESVASSCNDLLIHRKYGRTGVRVSSCVLFDLNVAAPLVQGENHALNLAHIPIDECVFYDRMLLCREMYHSKTYKRQGKKSFDSAVNLKNGTYGVIEKKILHGDTVFLLLRSIKVERNFPVVSNGACTVPHIKVCELYPFGELQVVNSNQVFCKSILMKTDSRTYVSIFSKFLEKD